MFVNCSNHPSERWNQSQQAAAREYGEIVDIPFPNVPVHADVEKIGEMAFETAEKILAQNPECIMVQGEFTLSYAIIHYLRKKGIRVVAACSERRVTEEILENGTTKKNIEFLFAGFREYIEIA